MPFPFLEKLVTRKSEKQGTFFFGVAEQSEAVAGFRSSGIFDKVISGEVVKTLQF